MTSERLLNLFHNEYQSFIAPKNFYRPTSQKQISGYAPCFVVGCVADTVTCPSGKVPCSNWENCLSGYQFCNGIGNCEDNWDEDDSVCGQSDYII